ncbi:triadin-like [Linepithema humile]|uniref:triadin-like n=1 Tax=Linepithema humile TaxID=83485 RepID=UPI00351E34E8
MEEGEPSRASTPPPATPRTEDPQPGSSTQVEGLPPPTVDFEDCLISSGEDEGMEDGTTALPSTSMGIPTWVPAGERTDPTIKFASAQRGQGRPRKDGTGPFIDSDQEQLEMEVRGETASDEEEEEVMPPSLTGPQKREAVRSITKMEKGSTEELYKSFDRKLLTIEKIRQCSKNIRGQQSGRIKMNVFVLREVLKTLTSRAAHGGDPGFWKARFIAEKRNNAALKAQVRQIDTQMKLQRVELAELREREGRRPLCEPMPSPTRGGSPLPPLSMDRAEVLSPAQEREDEGMECDTPLQVPIEISLKGIMEALQTLTNRMEALESGLIKTRLPPSAPSAPPAPDRKTKGPKKRKRTKKVSLKKAAPNTKAAKTSGTGNQPNKDEEQLRGGGGVLLEIPGKREKAETKASYLASEMRIAIGDTDDVAIKRPSRRLDLRLSGIMKSVSPEDVREALAKVGECSPKKIKLGPWHPLIRGKRSIWAQGPDRAAVKAAEAGRVKVGWSDFGVVLLESRPARCYRCHARGHMRQSCPSTVDRTDCCMNCGEKEHKLAQCKVPAHCPICVTKGGKEVNHRAGSESCPPVPPRRKPPSRPMREEREVVPGGGGESNKGPTPSTKRTTPPVEEDPEPTRPAPVRDSVEVEELPVVPMEVEPKGPTSGQKRARAKGEEGEENPTSGTPTRPTKVKILEKRVNERLPTE